MRLDLPQNELETDLGYGKLFAILIRRRFWLLSVFLAVATIAVVKTKWYTDPVYESRMQLLIEPNYPAKATLEGEQEAQTSEQDYATQLTLMRSSQFKEKAVELLHSRYPLLERKELEKNLTLSQIEEGDTNTRIFEAVYTDNDPLKTQQVLEAMQKVYQEYNLEQDRLRLKQGLSFINEGLPTAQDKLTQAEGALEKFRESQNLIDPEQQAKTVADALNAVEKQQLETQIQYQAAQARYNALQEQLGLSPEEARMASRLSESSRYQELLNQLQQTELALAEQQTIFTNADPEIQKLLEQRQSQLVLLQQEVERVLNEVPLQLQVSPEELLKTGQLSSVDITLARQLTETQSELLALEAQLQSLAQSEQELRVQLNQFPGLIAKYNQLQPEVDIQRLTLEQLLEKRQEISLEITRGGFNWQLVEPPQVGEQIAPSLKKNLALGVVVGLFLGGIAALIRESFDDRVHSSDELKQKVALPLLGIIPKFPPIQTNHALMPLSFRKTQLQNSSLLQNIYGLPFRESLDLIYKNIQLLTSPTKIKSLLVTSAFREAGKSTLVLGLALSAARLHQKVLLIDANLRYPSLHKQLNLNNEQGLSNFLSGEISLPYFHQLSVLGLSIDVFTSGPNPNDPVKLLSSQKMRHIMMELEKKYDLILLDTTSVLGTVDVLETASFCNGIVMIEKLEKVTQYELNQATVMLQQLNVIGIVANGASSSHNHSWSPIERNGSYLNPSQRPIINLENYEQN